MKKILLIILICLTFSAAWAQSEKVFYSFERMEWANTWLGTGNAAGLADNSLFLGDSVSNFNHAYLKGDFASGGYRNIYDPSMQLAGNLGIDSYMKLGNVFLHGRVDYIYDFGKDYRWKGLVDPLEMPFMMADSIPGNISHEIYSLGAGIGIPLKNGWSIGVDASYDASIMAKHKDLRNKNTRMVFDIAPGVSFAGQGFEVGLNLGYRRNTEKIEYLQVDASTEKYLFDLYGMWLYNSNGFASAEQKRYKEADEVYAGLQLGITFGAVRKLRIFNDFEVRYASASQTETGYNNLRFGDTRQLRYSDALSLFVGTAHRVSIKGSSSAMNAYRFLQRQELDPDSKVRRWVTYGDPVFCYDRRVLDGEASYTFRRVRHARFTDKGLTAFDINWEITAGARGYLFKQNYYEHPVTFSQQYGWAEPFVTFSKYWKWGLNLFDLTPSASYTIVSGNSFMNDIVTGGAQEGETTWQLTDPLEEEYSFFASDRFNASLSLRYGRILRKSSVLYVKGSYSHTRAVSGEMKDNARHNVNLTIGYTF